MTSYAGCGTVRRSLPARLPMRWRCSAAPGWTRGLKQLAELRAAALVTCEFCVDVGSALAAAHGIIESQLRDLPRFADSDTFSPDEKLALEFAEAMSRTPAVIAGELRDRLLNRISPAQVTELAATLAWENNRGRLNQALGRPAGLSGGAVCAIPEQWPVDPARQHGPKSTSPTRRCAPCSGWASPRGPLPCSSTRR